MSAVENKSNVKHDSGVRLRLLQWIERDATEMPWAQHTMPFRVGLGDMAQKIITIIIFISVDIDNYHDKCQIFISFKFKARFLLQSESFRNQTINFP